MKHTAEYRVERLERAFLSLAALLTGTALEAAAQAADGEAGLQAMKAQLAADMQAMADEMK